MKEEISSLKCILNFNLHYGYQTPFKRCPNKIGCQLGLGNTSGSCDLEFGFSAATSIEPEWQGERKRCRGQFLWVWKDDGWLKLGCKRSAMIYRKRIPVPKAVCFQISDVDIDSRSIYVADHKYHAKPTAPAANDNEKCAEQVIPYLGASPFIMAKVRGIGRYNPLKNIISILVTIIWEQGVEGVGSVPLPKFVD